MPQWIQAETHTIRVTALGAWLSDETLLHPRVAQLFQKNVAPNFDGSYDVVLGHARQRIGVADTPYQVHQMRLTLDDAHRLRRVDFVASDEMLERLDPTTLMQSTDHVLYCRIVRAGLKVPCRFTPGQYHELALWIREESGHFVLPMGGALHPIRPYCAQPERL